MKSNASVSLAILLLLLLGLAQGDSWNVSQNESIQAAIDKASPGDIILVEAGTYNEILNITKPLILKGIEMPVVDSRGNGSVITLSADGIVLDGFVAKNSGKLYEGVKVISNDNIIKNNILRSCGLGIALVNSSNNTVEANDASNNSYGIRLSSSGDNTIRNNTASNDHEYGIYLSKSSKNALAGNNANYNNLGIYLDESYNNSLAGNNAHHNREYGIFLKDSINNTMKKNLMSGNVFNFESRSKNDIDASNLADGKAIYYLENAFNTAIDSPSDMAGTIYCLNCSNITIRNQNLTNNGYGVYFYNTTGSVVENSTFHNNKNGIILQESGQNTIAKNNVSHSLENGIMLNGSINNVLIENVASNNTENGISISSSNNGTIQNNIANQNQDTGIKISKGSGNEITNNTAFNNTNGIGISDSNNGTIQNNIANQNQNTGIKISKGSGNEITNNTANNNTMDGIFISDSNNNIIKGNKASFTANGNGITLRTGLRNTLADNSATYNKIGIHIIKSGDSILTGNDASLNQQYGFSLDGCGNGTFNDSSAIENGKIGILLRNSKNNTIFSNEARNNLIGIVLYRLSDGIIGNNNISSNKVNGISLEDSHNNTVDGNIASYNVGGGITLLKSKNNTLKNNNVFENLCGIALNSSPNNTISSNNKASDNKLGAYLHRSNRSKITANDFLNNEVAIATNFSYNNTLDKLNLLNNSKNIIINENEAASNYSVWKDLILPKNIDQYLQHYEKLFGISSGLGGETSRTSVPSSGSATTASGGGDSGADEGESLRPSLTAFEEAVESVQRKLSSGKIAYSNITQMEANRTYEFEARVAINESLANLTGGILAGPAEVQGLKVSRTMKVTLTGDEFEIQPRSEEVQIIPEFISGHKFGQWFWNIKPRQGGIHTLTLAACAVITVPNWPEKSMCLETIRVPINVTVKLLKIQPPTPWEWFMSLINSIYAKIAGLIAFLIAVFTLLDKIKPWIKKEKPKN